MNSFSSNSIFLMLAFVFNIFPKSPSMACSYSFISQINITSSSCTYFQSYSSIHSSCKNLYHSLYKDNKKSWDITQPCFPLIFTSNPFQTKNLWFCNKYMILILFSTPLLSLLNILICLKHIPFYITSGTYFSLQTPHLPTFPLSLIFFCFFSLVLNL